MLCLNLSWPSKWKKIGSAKKLQLNLGIQGDRCTFKYFKIKKDLFIYYQKVEVPMKWHYTRLSIITKDGTIV